MTIDVTPRPVAGVPLCDHAHDFPSSRLRAYSLRGRRRLVKAEIETRGPLMNEHGPAHLFQLVVAHTLREDGGICVRESKTVPRTQVQVIASFIGRVQLQALVSVGQLRQARSLDLGPLVLLCRRRKSDNGPGKPSRRQ